MTIMKDYDRSDATALAELVKKKKATPLELCQEAIRRIRNLNPKLNAVICPMFDHALSRAKGPLPKGPFTGVPFLLKDYRIDMTAGYPLAEGCRAWKDYIPGRDSEIVKRYRDAGLVILGKTTVPEFCLLGTVEPVLTGKTCNPWNTAYSTGGSSGGSAAAVASRMVPMASAGDGGGSIRIPSSNCGLFGLKPTRGRTPLGPEIGESWQGAAVSHVLTLSVRDSAAMLDATRGADPGAPYVIPLPEKPYLQEIKKSPGKLRIAFTTKSMTGSEVHPDCAAMVEDTAVLLGKLGHSVEMAEPSIDGKAIAMNYLMMYMGEVAADIASTREMTGVKPRRKNFERLTWFLGELGRTYSACDFVSSMRLWNTVSRQFSDFFRTYDMLLTPVCANPPLPLGATDPKPYEVVLMEMVNTLRLGRMIKLSGMLQEIALQNVGRFPFTFPANMTGLPAMSVPLYWTADNLPCGAHFIGRFGDEATLFQLAAQLEKTRPWFDRRPPALS